MVTRSVLGTNIKLYDKTKHMVVLQTVYYKLWPYFKKPRDFSSPVKWSTQRKRKVRRKKKLGGGGGGRRRKFSVEEVRTNLQSWHYRRRLHHTLHCWLRPLSHQHTGYHGWRQEKKVETNIYIYPKPLWVNIWIKSFYKTRTCLDFCSMFSLSVCKEAHRVTD